MSRSHVNQIKQAITNLAKEFFSPDCEMNGDNGITVVKDKHEVTVTLDTTGIIKDGDLFVYRFEESLKGVGINNITVDDRWYNSSGIPCSQYSDSVYKPKYTIVLSNSRESVARLKAALSIKKAITADTYERVRRTLRTTAPGLLRMLGECHV